MFPSIQKYLEALNEPATPLRTLGHVKLPLNEAGRPYMIAGNFSVVFKIIVNGKPFALKCFIREESCSSEKYIKIANYLSKFKDEQTPFCDFEFIEDEIYVFDDCGNGKWYPVVLMEWCEGETLGCVVRRALRNKDVRKLNELAVEFDRIVVWLQERGCAHGDLKFDNIIVVDSGGVKLVDYDGVFVPEMRGMSSCELGTKDFQHPLRDVLEFGPHMDDYSAVLISTILHAGAYFPELLELGADDELKLLSSDKMVTECNILFDNIVDKWLRLGRSYLVRLAMELKSPVPAIENLLDIFKSLNKNEYQPNGSPQVYECDNRFGYRDDGGEFIAPIFDFADEFSGNFALVRFRGKELIINRMGCVVFDVSDFKYVEMLSPGVARTSTDAINWEMLYLIDDVVS